MSEAEAVLYEMPFAHTTAADTPGAEHIPPAEMIPTASGDPLDAVLIPGNRILHIHMHKISLLNKLRE